MITRRTKIQLLVFVFITLIGVSYVGARYARLDKAFIDQSYAVTAHFSESGGIFDGAEVTYRGVTVGSVSDMQLTDDGVDVVMEIDNDSDPIPQDTLAVVGNRSAVGEQYVEFQPEVDGAPFLEEGSEIPREKTRTPISTTKLLVDLDTTVNSVDKDALRTVVSELGTAFYGTSDDLKQIIDTSTSFIRTANANFGVTKALIKDSNTVLNTQLDSARSIRSFSHDLALFSTTLVRSDPDLRKVIDSGSATANQLRRFLEANDVDLGQLIHQLVVTGNIVVAHLDGVEQVLVLYPYVVGGGYTVVAKDSETGLYDAHFGLITQQNPPVCTQGYDTKPRSPQDRKDLPMDLDAHCAEPAAQSNARGAQHAPRAGTAYRAPVVARYDTARDRLRWGAGPTITYTGGAERAFGADSWKWLLMQPLAGGGQ